MIESELAPWVEKYQFAPEGWEPLAALPIKREALVEYLLADDSTRQTYGVSNLDFVTPLPRKVPTAWREVTNGPLYEWWVDRLMRISARMELPNE